jgi:hypothetical protein
VNAHRYLAWVSPWHFHRHCHLTAIADLGLPFASRNCHWISNIMDVEPPLASAALHIASLISVSHPLFDDILGNGPSGKGFYVLWRRKFPPS